MSGINECKRIDKETCDVYIDGKQYSLIGATLQVNDSGTVSIITYQGSFILGCPNGVQCHCLYVDDVATDIPCCDDLVDFVKGWLSTCNP